MINSVGPFLGVGKLFIYLLQVSPLPRILPKGIFRELIECDLCLGFWVYLVLGVLLKKDLDEEITKKNKLISRLTIAGVSTFIMHLMSIGWREKFGTYIIE
jgi:hypothetical protein